MYLIFIKEIIIKNKKKKENLYKWLCVWYENAPLSEEYIAKRLMIPNEKIKNNNIKSKANILSTKLKFLFSK